MRTALAVLGWCAATLAQAQISEPQAEQLMRLSGQWEQLASMATQMQEGLVQGLSTGEKPAPPELVQRVKVAATRAFGVEPFRATARRSLAESVRLNYLPELMRWYQSPVARRISQTEADKTAAKAEGDLKQRTQAGMALVQAATPERQQLLLKLVEVTRAPSMGVDLVINMWVALPVTLARFDPQAPRVNETELRGVFEAQRPQLLTAFETLSLASMATTYQSLPDDALAAYVAFMATSAGEHYTDLGTRAFEAAILGAIAALQP
ncbi:MAG: hypothetical protein Q8K45_19980 [Rubrivivax sp.]|nr:hypothetical protein [Rubrivivax sp.]